MSESAAENFRAPDELLQAQSLANLLDSSVRIPIINIKFGLDFLVGLIPVIGDTIMLLAALKIVHYAKRLGVPKALISKMLRNCLIDVFLGFVPILGDLVDIWFKASLRNVRIMEQWWVSQNKDKIDALRAQMVKDWEQQNVKSAD